MAPIMENNDERTMQRGQVRDAGVRDLRTANVERGERWQRGQVRDASVRDLRTAAEVERGERSQRG